MKGTTGNPKGATLSHNNVVNNAYFVGLRLGYNEKVHMVEFLAIKILILFYYNLSRIPYAFLLRYIIALDVSLVY